MKLLRYLLILSLLASCLLGTATNAAENVAVRETERIAIKETEAERIAARKAEAEQIAAKEPEFDGYLVEIDAPVHLLSASDADFPEMTEVYAPASLYQAADEATVDALRDLGVLRHAEPNYIVTLDDTPALFDADTAEIVDAILFDASEQWYMSALDMDWVRAQGFKGEGVRVGIVDSGLYAEHQEFQGVNILSGANYCVGEFDPARLDISDSVGHGTFVSGLIAASEETASIVGLAPNVELVPLKCFESKSGSVANISAAIYDAVDTWHCQVLNLSLGLEKDSAVLRKAVEYADAAGVIMVAAAGNLLSGSHNASGDPLNYPAAYPQVIGVGAIGANLSVANFSYRNDSVEVCAPGQNLRGPSYTNATKYVSGYGTSYAAPMVTAAAALTLSARPGLTAAEFRDILRDTVRDDGPAGYDTSYGYGALHMGHLLSAATGNLAHQITLYRQELAETDSPTPALIAAAYAESGALLDTLDVSPPVALDREPDTTPILSEISDDYPEETFQIPGAARWRLFALNRSTYAPTRAAIALYSPATDSGGNGA